MKSYTIEQKLRIVQFAKATTIYGAAKKYGVDRRRVREWMMQEEALAQSNPRAFRLSGAGRKPSDAELEELLVARITDMRHDKQRVTRSAIVKWAAELSADTDTSLTFSHGWLERFLDRHDFVLRKATNKPVLTDVELVDRAARFVLHTKELIARYNIEQENIYCLDETALFFDHEDDRTINFRGAHHVPVCYLLTQR